MKAIAYQQCLPIAHAESLLDVDLPERRPARMTFWSRSAPSQPTRWTPALQNVFTKPTPI